MKDFKDKQGSVYTPSMNKLLLLLAVFALAPFCGAQQEAAQIITDNKELLEKQKEMLRVINTPHVFDARTSDSFDGIDLNTLIKRYDDQLRLAVNHSSQQHCVPIYNEVKEDKVDVIKAEWFVTDYDDKRLEEFKHCNRDNPSKEFLNVGENHLNYGWLSFDADLKHWYAGYKKYNLGNAAGELIWLEIIPSNERYSSYNRGTLGHVNVDLCLINRNSSGSLWLEFINESKIDLSLVKNGIFVRDDSIYSFTLRNHPITGYIEFTFSVLGKKRNNEFEQIDRSQQLFCGFSNAELLRNTNTK